jgi:hypothetical protein
MPPLEEDIAAVVHRFGYQNVGLVWGLGLHGWATAEARDSFLDKAKQWMTGAIKPGGALSMADSFPMPAPPQPKKIGSVPIPNETATTGDHPETKGFSRFYPTPDGRKEQSA